MKQVIVIFVLVLFWCSQPAIDDTALKNDISGIMAQQKQAWNDGEIEGFMAHYWQSENFTFQSGNKRLHGWGTLLAMYKKKYAGANMGQLDFTDIEIHVIDRSNAYVLGRWTVVTADTSKQGLFTLLFRQVDGEWKIIHDHSS